MFWIWMLWFFGFVLVGFAVFETYAHFTNQATLSETVWKAETRWPALSLVLGMTVGAVSGHFFGWNPGCSP